MRKSILNPRIKVGLVIQGGTLRSIFTSGVLDAFIATKFYPFKYIIGVSGGAMCMAYYLCKQYGSTYNIMHNLSTSSDFISWKNIFNEQGMINLEYLDKYAKEEHPLDLRKINRTLLNTHVETVTTSLKDGKPKYLVTNKENIYQHIKASGTLPFFTKGQQIIDGHPLMDGGLSDPIPVKRAIDMGCSELVVIRTLPKDYREEWSYFGKIGSYWHRNNEDLKHIFENESKIYNDVADYLDLPNHPVKIHQIAPEKHLETTSYSTNKKRLDADYRNGLQMGLNMVQSLKRKKINWFNQ